MSFDRRDIRRGLEAVGPTPVQLKNLADRLEAAQAAPTCKGPGRRAAVALALCAALLVTAVAAGPSVWSALGEQLGPFASHLTPLTGSSTSEGVELKVVGVLSDGVTARFYLTARDERGGRLDGYTSATFDLEGGALSWGANPLAFDRETGTLLLELEVAGLPDSGALTLSGGTLAPNSYQVSVEPELRDDLQRVQTYEGLEGFSTAMGFDSGDNFCLRVQLAQGYGLSTRSTAFVYFSDGSAWCSGAEQVSYLSDGQQLRLEGITRSSWAQVEKIWLLTSYTGPLEPIEGDWRLTLDCGAVQTWSTDAGFTLEAPGLRVTQVQASPLGVVVSYTGTGEWLDASRLQVQLTGGEFPAWAEVSGWNWGGEGCAIWSFQEPVELDDIASVTLLGETVPLTEWNTPGGSL